MTTDEKLIKNKLGLLQLASYLKNVSEACRATGYNRDTFSAVGFAKLFTSKVPINSADLLNDTVTFF